MDLKALTDDDLNALRVEVLTEQERRADLAGIPQQVADLTARFVAGGGDPADLTAAVDAGTGD
ncbi:hypothetical protein MF406_14135 [Georgenia sp. TF02-10]|uniref:hypothetical protein n=1 Tax=Georgenia sp. TF02-10 TaxID=2917725 RepID=UPI001FA6F1A2|nr:hypothetical protein [Georgenia sp. TF02-10]UNX54072.1 hypothetical protein MF406_14135 [Georgenia sp. TF02-10]